MILKTKKNLNFNLIYPAAVNFFQAGHWSAPKKMFERQFVILAAAAKATKTWVKNNKSQCQHFNSVQLFAQHKFPSCRTQ